MPGAVVPNVITASKHPGHVVGYSRQNPVAGALLIWIALIAVSAIAQYMKAPAAGVKLPNQQGFVALGVASVAVVLVAKVAPNLVTWVLLAFLVVQIATNPAAISTMVQKGFASVSRAVPGARPAGT